MFAGKLTTCYEHSSGDWLLNFTLSYRCILLLIICQLCVTRYHGFVYILSTVLLLLSFTQPVAVTGRRHLRHRPVELFYLFIFISLRLAPAGGISATVARLTLTTCARIFIYLFVSLFARSVVAQ